MALPRIKIAKDKADLVQKLLDIKGTTGAFQTYADIAAFAASIGIKYQKRIPLMEISNTEPAPISLEIFMSRGYDWLIKLIAVYSKAIIEDESLKIISSSNSEAEEERVKIFEEYINGGLEYLRQELKGSVDYTERLLLILSGEKFAEESIEEEFDLSRFL